MVLLGVFGMGHFLRTVSVRNEVSSYSEPWWWLWLSVSVCLVIFAGVVSGLTLGLMSLWLMDLEVLQHSGSDEEKKQVIPQAVCSRHGLAISANMIWNYVDV
ncbi:putative DUF21 domain-containing protein At1g03270 isoform X6 [Physcomitrium patens]|uniref:putative DUF21 domain-containing protein At1g03270 isoform X6 n=1 Tax=Physcomitrium patens TaxID=3218 RepID=UPI003CCDCC60